MQVENFVVQGLWIGASLGRMERLSIKSFLANGHQYHLYVYEPIKHIPKGVVVQDANAIIPSCEIFAYAKGPGKGSFAAFSNIFRYQLLCERGGWWADLDVVCLRPFDFPAAYVFGYENLKNGKMQVGSAVFKVPQECQFIKDCLQESRSANRKDLRWGQIGPELMDRKVRAYLLEHFVMPSFCFYPINYWEKDQEVSELSSDRSAEIQNKAFAIHLWNEMWRRDRLAGNLLNRIVKRFTISKKRLYGRNTLLGQLQRKYL